MKTIQEMLQELSQCIVTVSGEFRFRTNWNGGKVPQPDLDVFDPNVPFCIENVGEVPVEIGLYDYVYSNMPFILHVRRNCKISYNLKTWQDYDIVSTKNLTPIPDVNKITLKNNGDRVYIKADFEMPPRVERDFFTRLIVVNQSKDTKIRARGNIISLNKGSDDAYKKDYLKLSWQKHNYCFSRLFEDCTSLIQAPELPATHLIVGCYSDMFSGCTSLIQAPELPATDFSGVEISGEYVYTRMFKGCTSLTQAPKLPNTNLSFYCYMQMFEGCTSLAQAPELPATKTVDGCYYSMFKGCTSLTQAPVLPATTLARSCYANMFNGCTALTQAPELPATTLANYCYDSMFSGCVKINYVKCLATNTSATECTMNWLNNVASSGTFECDNKKYFTIDSPNGIPTGWSITEINPAQPEPEKPDLDTFDPNVPFCIENVGETQANIQYNTKNTNIKISKDYKTWNDYTKGDSITLDPTERVYIKSDYVKDTEYHPRFVFNGNGARLRARGNIASLIYGTNDTYVNKYTSTEEHCYKSMFMNCKSLTQAPKLPATTLASYCYYSMFDGCTSLTQAPELSATTLANSCCYYMFYGCTSLTQAPKLPAKTLADYCYRSMFQGCTSLTQATELPTTTLAKNCYYGMFSGCTSLTQAPKLLPATTLAPHCYEAMFYGCTSLTQAPELPATTLAIICYGNMFQGCTKLNYVKCLATDTSATDCTYNWLEGVSAHGDFYTPAATNWTTGQDGIPIGWTRHDIT